MVVAITNIVHGLTGAENIMQGKVHGVVEKTFNVTLVTGNKVNITIETLTHLEDTGCLGVLRPEILRNLGNSVDPDTVEVELADGVFNPFFQVGANILIGLIKISQTAQPTVFNRPLVIPINIALRMVVLRLI